MRWPETAPSAIRISRIRQHRASLSTEGCCRKSDARVAVFDEVWKKTTDCLEVGCCTVGDRIYRRGRHEDSYIRVPGEIAEPLGDTIRNEL